MTCDRGSRLLRAHGICPRNIGQEPPELLGKVERRGDIWKKLCKQVVHAQRITGENGDAYVSDKIG